MNNYTGIFHQAFVLLVIAILTSCGGDNSSSPAPTPGTLQLSATSYSETEGTDVVIKVSVTRTGGSDGDVSVDFAVTNGSADAGDDYLVKNTGTVLRWADGDASSRGINIELINDTSVELTEDLTVTLSNVSTATLGSNSAATLSIVDDDSITVIGVVSAPGGLVSFNGPTYMERMFAALFGKAVNASVSDLVAPVASVPVGVYEIDADGNPVGTGPITTATTDGNGSYTLAAPLDAPASQYIVRAESPGGGDLDGRIVAATVNVDPVTDAASAQVTDAASDLASISVDEITVIQQEVGGLAVDIENAGSLTATGLSAALNTEASNNEEVTNVVTSSAAAGTICGTVTNSSGDPLGNINIVARDFGNWVTRAKTKTADDGTYCVNVPVAGDVDVFTNLPLSGEYILGAINRTGDNTDPGLHASEWWSTGGMAYNQFDAHMIAVTSITPDVLDVDFMLANGGRIRGTVTASDTGLGVEGVKVVIRDFDNRTPLASARSNAAGNYRVNVIPGKYLLAARNKTVQPYASEVYDGSTGTNDRNLGIPVTVSVASSTPRNFVLASGHKLSGIINDGTPVSGMRVMVDNVDGGPADRLRTNKLGEYRIWLRPDIYEVYAYGQRDLGVDLTAGNQTIDFSGTVNAVSAVLQDIGGNPLSQVKFRLYDPAGPIYLGNEISNSDGTVTMYTDLTGNHVAEFKIDRASSTGGNIFMNQTQLASGSLIPVNGNYDIGTVNLPDGGVLRGNVYAGNAGDTTSPLPNFSIEVRDATDGSDPATATRFTRIRTRGDGSYVLTIPPGTYERVKMLDAIGAGDCDGIDIVVGKTTTVNYYDGNDTCEVIPAP